MSPRRLVLFVLGCLVLSSASTRAGDAADMQAEMEAMQKAIQPGPMHEQMRAMVGEWTTHSKVWMQPGMPPMESDGTAVYTMALDGRFLVQESTGTMMGQPYTGMNLYGYHNGKQKYQAVWTYSLSTTMLLMEGVVQEDGTVVFEGTYMNDMGQEADMKVTARATDENTMVESIIGQDGLGNEDGVLMETTYTRVSAGR